jgi:NAD(P)H-dependent FMN reductase
MRVVTLCGSHHSGSTDAAVLAMIADRLAEAGVTADTIDVSVDLPAFRPEAMGDPPEIVQRVRTAFEQADGAVFAIPEYAGGVPGWVKNVTDWMVASASLYQRPVVVVGAATGGGSNAIVQLARTLIWQGAFVVATCSIAAPLTMVRDGAMTDADTLDRLRRVGAVLLAAMRGESDPADTTAAALTSSGIDPLDRLS